MRELELSLEDKELIATRMWVEAIISGKNPNYKKIGEACGYEFPAQSGRKLLQKPSVRARVADLFTLRTKARVAAGLERAVSEAEWSGVSIKAAELICKLTGELGPDIAIQQNNVYQPLSDLDAKERAALLSALAARDSGQLSGAAGDVIDVDLPETPPEGTIE